MIGTNAYNAASLQTYTEGLLTDKQNYKKVEHTNILQARLEERFVRSLFCARFSWDMGDYKVTPHFIETNLYYYGLIAFFKDKTLGHLCLPARVVEYNVYYEPTKLSVFGNNYSEIIDAADCVLLRNTPDMLPPIQLVKRYTQMIADVSRTCEVYTNAMKKPLIITGSFDKKNSIDEVINRVFSNEYCVVIDEKLKGVEPVQFVSTDHNSNDLRGIYMHKKSLFDELLGRLGIESSNVYKAAQVSEDEINKNDLIPQLIINQSYECRQQAVKELAEKAGNSITCTLNVDYNKAEEKGESNEE